MLKFYEISYNRDTETVELYTKHVTLYANSRLDAFIQFIYNNTDLIIYDEEYNIDDSNNEMNYNLHYILREYYKFDETYCATLELVFSCHELIHLICLYPYNFNKKLFDKEEEMKKIRLKNKSFISKLSEKDKKFLIKVYNKKWLDISIKEIHPKKYITFMTINRILKKVQNTSYWNIWRMIKN